MQQIADNYAAFGSAPIGPIGSITNGELIQMARGDHLQAGRPGHHHDGIDLGDGRVVHFAADKGGSKSTACIRISSLEEFAGDGDVTIREYAGERDPEAIIGRALSRVDATGYDLVSNNCEHFARWCVTGDHQSAQVVVGISAATAVGLPWIAGNMGLGLVASLGFVGTSGAGIMSGLATAGALVGGGAVAGVAVLGAIPAVVGTAAIHRFALVDDDDLPATERRARTAGRFGAIGGGGWRPYRNWLGYWNARIPWIERCRNLVRTGNSWKSCRRRDGCRNRVGYRSSSNWRSHRRLFFLSLVVNA